MSVLLLLFALHFHSVASPPEAVYLNNQALREFAAKNSRQGYDDLLKALDKDPLNPVLQYNLGAAFMLNEELDKALKQFQQALRYSRDPELNYHIHFAAALAATQLKNIDLALQHYQQALEMRPDANEVKTNIELLWQGQQGGQGEGKNKQENQDGKGSEDQKNDSEGQEQKEKDPKDGQGPVQQQKPQPQPFKSKELTQDQVHKILEELKNQEQKIRAMDQDKGAKDNAKGKDW